MEDTLSTVSSEEVHLQRLTHSCAGLDIGGSLCKIAYFEKDAEEGETPEVARMREIINMVINDPATYGTTGIRDSDLEYSGPSLGGTLYLMRFETHKMEKFLEMVKGSGIITADTIVSCTGGGSRKYRPDMRRLLNFEIARTDELQCLIDGINFCLHNIPGELYKIADSTIDGPPRPSSLATDPVEPEYPFLVVNIGSGVSIMKVYENGKNERVGGTALGGATFFGLCCMLTGCKSFTEALQLAENGNSKNTDLLVGDIYGGDYDEYNLPADVVAASMGKLCRPSVRAAADPKDIARAMLEAITNNIASIALLHAKAHNVSTVIYAGNFLRHNKISTQQLATSMRFWSKGTKTALFLKHEGYLGAIGSLLHACVHQSKVIY